MYQNILVAIDPHNPAKVSQAITVANMLNTENGKITLVSIIEPIPPYAAEYLPIGQLETNRKETEAQLKLYVGDDYRIQTSIITSSSSAAALIEFSEEHQSDLIIIASHRPGIRDYFLGSTAGRVVRHSPCAVHVLR